MWMDIPLFHWTKSAQFDVPWNLSSLTKLGFTAVEAQYFNKAGMY